MNENRRTFLSKSSLFAGSLIVLSKEAATASALASQTTNRASGEVLGFLGKFSKLACYHGGCIAGDINGSEQRFTDLLVRVDNLERLVSALADHPFDGMFASGDTFSFEHGGSSYTVKTMVPDLFDQEIAAVRKASRSAYAHAAMTTGTTFRARPVDPFGAVSPTGNAQLAFAGEKVKAISARFGTLLEGLRASAYHQLAPTPEFVAFRASTLAISIVDAETASQVGAALVRDISPLSRVISRSAMFELVGSNLVSSSLQRSGRPSAEALIGRFSSLRAALSAETSDGAIWLAALLEREILDGKADRLIWVEVRFAHLQSRKDLAAAKGIVDKRGASISKPGSAAAKAGFDRWSSSFFGKQTDAIGQNDDPDGDGVPNLIEYALGMDPSVASRLGLPTLSTVDIDGVEHLALQYNKDLAKTDILYRVETSEDFGAGTWVTEGVEDRLIETDGTVERREASVPVDSNRRFLRLYVSMR